MSARTRPETSAVRHLDATRRHITTPIFFTEEILKLSADPRPAGLTAVAESSDDGGR
ncbi:hypothetical protein [Streptosporangium carneum]|uniref:hypothetical protein n=1 Tax=Streptosporangium carneum TaxID=47481 RepID=UPI0022F2BFA1|nr:hypothetical protein [Streptosporangium carneum]